MRRPGFRRRPDPGGAPALAFYVASNAVLIAYTVVLVVLIARRRRSAIVHNVVFHALSLIFLVGWHVLAMKSTVGLAIDAVPPVVMTAYILGSRRVRRTLRKVSYLDGSIRA
jgi:hypothetical protein